MLLFVLDPQYALTSLISCFFNTLLDVQICNLTHSSRVFNQSSERYAEYS